MWTVPFSFWDDYLDPLKVTFDGQNRLIYLNTEYADFDVKIDLYSASKRWLKRRINAKYFPPFRTIGGDPVGGGQYAGDIYFLINNWKIVVRHSCNLTGILYNDTVGVSPFIIEAGGGVVAKVSNLAYAYTPTGLVIPTVQEVATEVWNAQLSQYGNVGTAGKTVSTIKETTDTTLAVSV